MILQAPASLLLVVDFQSRLMPAIAGGAAAVENARRLLDVAALLDIPVVYTEENPVGLGHTVGELAPAATARVLSKMHFDAWREPEVRAAIPNGLDLVVVGCEAHVCVLQTVLGLRAAGRNVKVVRDAVASRRTESRAPRSPGWTGTGPRSSRPRWSPSNGSAPPTIRVSRT